MTAQTVLPRVGMRGQWLFSSPVDEVVSPSIVYECVAVRRIADIIAAGEDAYEKYYDRFKISKDIYNQDVRDGVCIVSLRTRSGLWQYVPSNRINSFPLITGVKYCALGIGVRLGDLPETLDLSVLLSQIEQLCTHYTSIKPTIAFNALSATKLVPSEQHELFMTALANNRPLFQSDTTRASMLQDELTAVRQKLVIAESYILSHLNTPQGGGSAGG